MCKSDQDHLDSLKTRFYNYIIKSDFCWEWIGGVDRNGYGQLIYKNKTIFAHRASWIIHNGLIPDGLFVLHTVCDNPPCVNPDHLTIGTHSMNMKEMVAKGRSKKSKKPARTEVKLAGKPLNPIVDGSGQTIGVL